MDLAHAFNKGTIPISLCGWATPTLKSFKVCQKQAHIKKVLKKCTWTNILRLNHTVLEVGQSAERRSILSVCSESFALLLGALECPIGVIGHQRLINFHCTIAQL